MLYLELVAGLVLLLAGGELLVRGASATAVRMGVSPLIVGITLVGFGTSTPELVASLEAAFLGAPGIAIGNVVGSNTANILLILGLCALIAPIACDRATMRRDGGMMLLAAVACVVAALTGHIGRVQGTLFVLVLAGYIAWCLRQELRGGGDRAEAAEAAVQPWPRHTGLALLMAVAGIGLTILGAHWLVDGSIVLAGRLGVSDAVIGLTVVAVGTSLPELAAGLMAALKRQSGIVLGNVVGSNIYNVLGILGVTALVHPLDVPALIVDRDVWVMLAVTVAMLVLGLHFRRIGRLAGALFLCAYGAYTALLYAA